MKHTCDRAAFEAELNELLSNPDVLKMAEFSQHRGKSTLQHVLDVAEVSFRIAEMLEVEIDEKSLAKGAIMHDYYLYTFFDTEIGGYRHGVDHPETALRNAKKIMPLNEKEENIIRSHMWPLTLFHPPQSTEAAIVALADKYCAVREMVFNKDALRYCDWLHNPDDVK